MVSAVGTLKGPLHGGANEEAMKLILKFKDPDEAERGVMEMLSRKEKITMRAAALTLGIKRVHEAKKIRGLFP